MHLLQYRVDFTPEIDHPGVKKALIRVHERTLGKYVFDGTLLYNTTRLAQVNDKTKMSIIAAAQFLNYYYFFTAAGIGVETDVRWIRRQNNFGF